MTNAHDDAELSEVLVHGLQPTTVTIVDYDPAWPSRFEAHATQLHTLLGGRLKLVEHIGSTSVPGLAAKPIIDIVVGIENPEQESAYLPELESAGYDLRVREPQHRCLRLDTPTDSVNLHCYPPEHVDVRRYLALRDQLRSNAADRELYATTKRELAGRQWGDVNYYADAKGPVIHKILAHAGWHE